MRVSPHPRTDPGVRHYRTGLLPQVMTPKRTVAAWRTRSSALATPARHCVRCVFYPNRFPLANPLPSTASAGSFEPLFGDFFGSMELSDFPCSFITGVCPQTSQCGLLPPWLRANMGSPGSRVVCFRTCSRSSTPQGLPASRAIDSGSVAFRLVPQRRTLNSNVFRGSILGPCVPLSTLQSHHYWYHRMTRGRCGSLLLHREALSSSTLHRF